MGENHSNKNSSTNSLYQKELVQSFISQAKGYLDAGQGEEEPAIKTVDGHVTPLVILPEGIDSGTSSPSEDSDESEGSSFRLEEDENSYKKKLAAATAAAAAVGGGAYALSKVRQMRAETTSKSSQSVNSSQESISDDLQSAYSQMKRLQKLLRLTHLSDGEMIEALSIIMSIQLKKVVEFGEIESYVKGVKSASSRSSSKDSGSFFTF